MKVTKVNSLNIDVNCSDGTRYIVSPSGYADTVILVAEDPVDVSVEVVSKDVLLSRFPLLANSEECTAFINSLSHE